MHDGDIYLLIGRRLRSRRRMLDMTQGQVGACCGLTSQQIQKYEAGVVAMPVARLIRLAQVLQTPLSDFIEGLPSVSPELAALKMTG